ncbi:hypothetical protein Mapa_011203 [Marchantia paleacea]|nr:hypothetical protein Mapa_011203 [Marchantia paleacea]
MCHLQRYKQARTVAVVGTRERSAFIEIIIQWPVSRGGSYCRFEICVSEREGPNCSGIFRICKPNRWSSLAGCEVEYISSAHVNRGCGFKREYPASSRFRAEFEGHIRQWFRVQRALSKSQAAELEVHVAQWLLK